MYKRKKVKDIVIKILKHDILKFEELFERTSKIVLEDNPDIDKNKIKASIGKLIGKSIFKLKNGYISLRISPTTEDLIKISALKDVDLELCNITLEDFETLEKWFDEIDEKTMRQTSAIVRRLLVDNGLYRLWKQLEFYEEPLINVPCLEDLLKYIDSQKILVLSAGGAMHKGMRVSKTTRFNVALTEEESIKLTTPSEKNFETLTLNDFIESICIVVDSTLISRRELIKYIANKLGGTHYDPSRASSRVEDSILIEKYKKLDEMVENKICDLKLVYFEFLSITQALLSSDDIKKMRERISKVIDARL